MADTIVGTGVKVSEPAVPVADKYNSVVVKGDDIDEEYEPDHDEPAADGDSQTPANTQSTPAKAPVNTPDQNAAFAEMRRKTEADARAKATIEAGRIATEQINKTIADMGLTDPYTNKPIKTKAEYDAYKERHETEKIGSELTSAGLSRETVDKLIASHPAVVKAEQALKEYQQAKEREQAVTAKTVFETQFNEIKALDPDIKTVDDLMALPEYPKMRDFIRKGVSIVDSYKLVNMDKLTGKKAQAAAQSARISVSSKDHLTSASSSRGTGEVPISKAQYAYYKKMRPKMTDKQIREDYARNRIK